MCAYHGCVTRRLLATFWVPFLLIVVMPAILAPYHFRCHCGGMFTACCANLKNIGTALELYAVDHGGQYPTRLSELCPQYLTVLPTCPSAAMDSYSQGYVHNIHRKSYELCCTGLHHPGIAGLNEPVYTSLQGLMDSGVESHDPFEGYLGFDSTRLTDWGQGLLILVCLAASPLWLGWVVSGRLHDPSSRVLEALGLVGLWLGWIAPQVDRLIALDPVCRSLVLRAAMAVPFPVVGVCWPRAPAAGYRFRSDCRLLLPLS